MGKGALGSLAVRALVLILSMALTDDPRAPLLSRNRIDEADNVSHNSADEAVSNTDYGSGVYRYPLYLQPGQFTSLEKLMFFVSSILLIFLCIFIGLYARSSFGDSLPSPVVPSPTTEPTPLPPPDKHYCLEPSCILASAHILQDVNLNMDPCDDFYAYACSNWINDRVLREDMAKTSVQSVANERTKQLLNEILNHPFNSSHVSPSQPSLLPPPDRIIDEQLFQKLQDFQHACMDEETIEQYDITPLYDMFRTIRDYLPLKYYYTMSSPSPPYVHGLSNALIYLAQHNVWPLFSFHVGADPKDSSRPSFSIWQGELGLPSHEYYSNSDILNAYSEVMEEILSAVFSKDDANEFGWKTWSPVATARRIISFEKQLATTYHQNMERWSLDQLQKAAPNIDWSIIIEALLPRGTPTPQEILIPSSTFVIELSDRIVQGANTRTLQLYLIWRVLWKYLDALGEEFVAPRRKLDAKLYGVEVRAKPPRWQTCLSYADHPFGFLLGRYLVRRTLDDLAEQQADDLLTSVGYTLSDRIQSLDWIHEEDKQRFHDKMSHINHLVGYPKSQPDTRSAISLAEYYADAIVNKDSFFDSVKSVNKWHVKQTMGRLSTSVDPNAWDISPQHTEAVYDPLQNKLQVPASILCMPFFDIQLPEFLNYGQLGAMVGREILHAFNGREWSNATTTAFEAKARCFIQQYSKFTIEGEHGQIYYVDGEQTLKQNIADNGGLLHAYLAWKRHVGQNDLPPGLDAWSREQLFFISFARMQCSKSTIQSDLHELSTSSHAPSRWRVNGPLMNSEEFSRAFACPVGKPMNPKEKCSVW